MEKKENKLPPVTQEAILGVDGIPDRDYPLRILRAHRENCNCKWVKDSLDPLLDVMNAMCDERAKILDDAIRVLEQHNVGVWDVEDYD